MMAILGDNRDKATTTLVGLHDLLGFGNMVASSGGTLDSAVGSVAYNRILSLRATLDHVQGLFPLDTVLFHFNDTVVAVLDVDIAIGSSHTDPSGIASQISSRDDLLAVLQFLGACASLHQKSLQGEEEERLGPGGRTFVVLGKRWAVPAIQAAKVTELIQLQANLAFTEAYLADSLGSAAGFDKRSSWSLYVNDLLWHVMVTAKVTMKPDESATLSTLGSKDQEFPKNLLAPNDPLAEAKIFHRKRKFYSLMSHQACDLVACVRQIASE